MKVSEVEIKDGKACAYLVGLLRSGRWELSGSDIEKYREALYWVHELAVKMAALLKDQPGVNTAVPPAAPPAAAPSGNSSSSTGFKIKSMGMMAGKKKSQRRK